MYPHERSLVKKYENRPFTIIGVNSDRDREQIKKRIKEEKITWRSFYAGSTSGAIQTRWNVSGWPTVYIIDHKGVIRFKSVGSRPMEDIIEKLVKEAESEACEPQEKKKAKVPERGL